jgi:hypothetical protein
MLLESSEVSQPFAAFMSQLPKPALHEATEHAPATHAGVPFGIAQRLPHAPQFNTLLLKSVSQPLAALMSQLPKPAVHIPTAHAPITHVAVALGTAHARPHAPQLATVSSALSQPFAAFMSQLPKPAAQPKNAHVPPLHAVTAFGRAQLVPHAPQLATVLSALSQPFAAFMSQLPKLAAQVIPQTPAVHCGAALGAAGHVRPQLPQCITLVLTLVSHPSAETPLQFEKPALHAVI